MNNHIRQCALVVGLAAGAAGCAGSDPCGEVGVICTVAGNGQNGSGDPEGTATEQPLSFPIDVTAAPDGRLYIVDFVNHCIRELDPDTGLMRIVMGNGTLESGCAEGAECDLLDTALVFPTAIAFDGEDALVSVRNASQVLRVDLAAGRITSVYGKGTRSEYSGDGGPAVAAAFDIPGSVVVDAAGDFLVLDQMNQVIRRVRPDGVVERVAGGCFTDDYDAGDLSCTAADAPTACGGSDKLTCGTSELACSTPCLVDFAGDGGPALDARFAFDAGSQALPSRMVRAPSGELLIADTLNRRIRRIDADGVIATVAGTGEQSGEGALVQPHDVAVDADGTIYIADASGSCVQAVRPGGEMVTVAGQCGTRGFQGDEGPATAALLGHPTGVEVAGDVLYVADASNDVVRAVRLR